MRAMACSACSGSADIATPIASRPRSNTAGCSLSRSDASRALAIRDCVPIIATSDSRCLPASVATVPNVTIVAYATMSHTVQANTFRRSIMNSSAQTDRDTRAAREMDCRERHGRQRISREYAARIDFSTRSMTPRNPQHRGRQRRQNQRVGDAARDRRSPHDRYVTHVLLRRAELRPEHRDRRPSRDRLHADRESRRALWRFRDSSHRRRRRDRVAVAAGRDIARDDCRDDDRHRGPARRARGETEAIVVAGELAKAKTRVREADMLL